MQDRGHAAHAHSADRLASAGREHHPFPFLTFYLLTVPFEHSSSSPLSALLVRLIARASLASAPLSTFRFAHLLVTRY